MRALALLVVALVLAGCGGAPTPTPTTIPTASTPATTTPPAPRAEPDLVAIDGRWPVPEDASRALVARATGAAEADMGAMILGESSLRGAGSPVAGPVLALDARAAELLGAPSPPERGEVVLAREVAGLLGASVGDELRLLTYVWPPSHVIAAFEMERVRACDPAAPAPLCALPTSPNGEAALLLEVPEGSSDLRFHADIVELAPGDYPAEWRGSFQSPSGVRTPFQTGAQDRTRISPPGEISGAVEQGRWTIRFTLDVNGTRAPGAIAGFITYRTLGHAPFEVQLLREQDTGRQLQRLLENGTRATASLRLAGTMESRPLGAIALLALPDARALLRVGEGNVTGLLLPAREGNAEAVQAAAYEASSPALRALHVRPALAVPVPEAGGALLAWAPPDLDLDALPATEGASGAALVVESLAPNGASWRVRNATVAARLLTLGSVERPWTMVPRAHWANPAAAEKAIASGPHLLLLSDDLVESVGGDPTNATYLRVELDSAIGPRSVFGMGTVAGGPSRTLWASAALVAALTAPAGARVVVPLADGADRAATEDAVLAAWAAHDVARWLGP